MRAGFSPDEVREVLDQGGRVPLPVLLRGRVRYFRDGVTFGSRAFVEEVFLKIHCIDAPGPSIVRDLPNF